MQFVPRQWEGWSLIEPEQLATSDEQAQPIGHFAVIDHLPIDTSYAYDADLQHTLAGRELLLDDLPYSITMLHDHYLHGFITYIPGILQKQQYYHCQRCGNHTQRLFAAFHCARCQHRCVYCRKCITMGRVSQCTPLVRWIGPVTEVLCKPDYRMHWSGSLSQGKNGLHNVSVT